MEFSKDRVEVSNDSRVISDYCVDVSVYNVYFMDGKDLDNCFHEAIYVFSESDEVLQEGLENFREDSLISWYGERLIPTIYDQECRSSMSLFIPNSLIHDSALEKVKATELSKIVGDELERYLENNGRDHI